MLDWSDGCYETTARQLEAAAERVIELAAVSAGERLLDVGCGTGNASLAAARRGARVLAIDPSAGLLERARARLAAAGVDAELRVGEAAATGAADAEVDVAVGVFSVIFAPDPAAAVAELVRVVRPGRGRVVIAAWLPGGAVDAAGDLLGRLLQPERAGESPWRSEGGVCELFAPHPVSLAFHRETLTYVANSPEAWFDDVEGNHPAWRAGRNAYPEAWPELRRRSLEVLRAGNLDPSGFRAESSYQVVVATRRG